MSPRCTRPVRTASRSTDRSAGGGGVTAEQLATNRGKTQSSGSQRTGRIIERGPAELPGFAPPLAVDAQNGLGAGFEAGLRDRLSAVLADAVAALGLALPRFPDLICLLLEHLF